jgi:hypothetical protein
MSSAHYLHPEFGYFCPGRGLRREWRVAVVSILFGMIIGASVVRLPAGNDRNGDNASTIGRLEGPRAVTVLPVATEPDSSLIDGTAAKGEPNGPIKPFLKRIVRVRLPKDRLSVAAAALARTEPEEPAPVAPLSTEASCGERRRCSTANGSSLCRPVPNDLAAVCQGQEASKDRTYSNPSPE